MSTPLITIAITCYNAQDTIGRAIKSALAQDWENTEILVVDDVSCDQSREVISSYTDRGVKLIAHEENTGPGGARQTLLNNANGEFVAFFDDDDESLPNRLSVQYARILAFEAQNPGKLCACYAAGTRRYPNGYELNIRASGQQTPPYGEVMAAHILYHACTPKDWDIGATPSCSLMARKKTFEAAGGFDPNFRRVEDLDFAVRLALKGGYFIGTEEQLFIQHASTGDDKTSDKNLKAEQQLVSKHAGFLKQRGAYTYALLWPELRHNHFTRNYIAFMLILMRLLINAPIKTIRHLLKTGPKRLAHEQKMKEQL